MSAHSWKRPVPGGDACVHVGCTAVRLGQPGRYRYRLAGERDVDALSLVSRCTGTRPPKAPRKPRASETRVRP